MYYDLAYVLVEAKTETIHKNAVSMILRSSWTKWRAREPPLSQQEFFRLLFILGHLVMDFLHAGKCGAEASKSANKSCGAPTDDDNESPW